MREKRVRLKSSTSHAQLCAHRTNHFERRSRKISNFFVVPIWELRQNITNYLAFFLARTFLDAFLDAFLNAFSRLLVSNYHKNSYW